MVKTAYNIPKVLGLSDEERKILAVLASDKEGTRNISGLAKEIDIPRTSLYGPLKSLVDRGLLMRRKHGREILYRLTEKDIRNTIAAEVAGFLLDGFGRGLSFSVSGMMVYQGRGVMLEAIGDFFLHLKNGRVLSIQGRDFWHAWISHLGQKEIEGFNQTIKENNIIFESIFPTDLMEQLLSRYGVNFLESYAGRATRVHTVDSQFLSFTSDLLIESKQVFIMNWESETGICIKDAETIRLMEMLFRFVQSQGRLVDIHAKIRSLIKE